MEIPWQDLEAETLDRLLSEIVTRDGTDYGSQERSTASKIAAARKALEQRQASLHWNDETETASLLTCDQVREEAAEMNRLKRLAGMSDVS